MGVTCEEREHQYVIRLTGEITVGCSADLKGSLVVGVSHKKDLALDLSAAADHDVTALQLLWAAIQAAQRTGKALRLVSALPENVASAIRDSGFEPLLSPLISPQAEGNPGPASEAADD